MGIIRKMAPSKYSDSLTIDGLPGGMKAPQAAAVQKLKDLMDQYQAKHPRASAMEVRKWAAKKCGIQIITKSNLK